MPLFGTSYPSVKLEDISTPCTDASSTGPPPSSSTSFDYIIVGAGPAGCVLANRLASNLPNASILLLERGQVSDTFQSRTPLLSLAYARSDDGVMKYDSAPQKCLKGRKMKIISGKLLGGTTRVNNGLYSRCSPYEFEEWGKGWEYAGLEKLYDRAERKVENRRTEQRDTGGEWSTRIIPTFFKSSKIFLDAVKEMGVPFVEDINNSSQPVTCITKLRTTVTAEGKRCSAYEAFLPQTFVQRHQNLKLCLGVVVQRIQVSLLAGQKVAEGVFVEDEKKPGSRRFVKGKEIILCAGAVASPQLLILSGIGPNDQLSKLGVETKVNLPGVGSHLQDHISIPLCYRVPISSSIHAMQSPPYFAAIKAVMQYLLHGTGIFISPVTEYTYFLHSDQYPANSSSPTVPASDVPAPVSTADTEQGPTKTSNLPDLEFAWIGAWGTAEDEIPSLGKHGFNTLLVQCPRPDSKGSITVTSSDARIQPIVDPNYLSSPRDLEIMRKGVLYGLDLGKKMMAKYPMTEALTPEGSDTEVVDEFIRERLSGAYHLSSTCRMAPREEGGVVNQELKVYGIEGLRVADASVFPRLVGMKPQATIVMVGEKCADILLQERNEVGSS